MYVVYIGNNVYYCVRHMAHYLNIVKENSMNLCDVDFIINLK